MARTLLRIAAVVAVAPFFFPGAVQPVASRRRALRVALGSAAVAPVGAAVAVKPPDFVSRQPGFEQTRTGLQYKDSKLGKEGKQVEVGDRVVFEWEGYTIGYFGRPFEAKKGVQGGDFEKDRDFDRFVVGRGTMIPALEEGVVGMREGGVRQLVFGADLGYPMVGDQSLGVMADPPHDQVGPKPQSFSGMRALNFVLTSKNDAVDKTLLLNVKVVRIDKPAGPRPF